MADRSRWARIGRALWRGFSKSPLTFSWLVVLFITTKVARSLSESELDQLLGERSTNLENLQSDPLQVLFSSLFWIDGDYWGPYLVTFCIFLVPAERWLGSLRWLVVGIGAHVLATFVSEGLLAWAIHVGWRSVHLVDVLDVGVSYFEAAIIGVLTYHIARPWRWVYLAGIVIVYISPLLVDGMTYTEIGHGSALALGLLAYPITRGRPGTLWTPSDLRRIPAAIRGFASADQANLSQRNS